MQAKLYVGNLSYQTTESELTKLFESYGTVLDVNIIRDRFSGQPKGFAFVELGSGTEAERALELDGRELLGRRLTVSEARPPRKDARKPHGPHGKKFGKKRNGYGGRRYY